MAHLSISSTARTAFVCATPFQVFTSLCLLLSADDFSSFESFCDIYIVGGFAQDERIAARLEYTGLFAEVVFVPAEVDAYGLGERKCDDAEHRLSQVQSIIGAHLLSRNRYSRLFFSLPTLTTSALCTANPSAETVLFDDGYGSYFGDILTENGWDCRPPDVRALWSPAMDRSSFSCSCEKISVPETDIFPQVLSLVFEYAPRPHKYRNKNTMFLSQPFAPELLHENTDCFLSRIMSCCQKDLLVKPHPRDDMSAFDNIDAAVDVRGHAMELLCAQGEIDDVSVLIGAFSTAQYIPAMIFGMRPRLLFLYKLMIADKNECARIDTLAEYVVALYGQDKDRICIAESETEALEFLNSALR